MTVPALDLATARAMIDGAIAKAEELGARVVVSVIDAGGHVVAKVRMDGALLVGVGVADDKAYTALAVGVPSGDLAELVAPGAPLYTLNTIQGGRIVAFGGGLPVNGPDGTPLGAIGVSGGTTEQDVSIAGAGLAVRG